MPEVKQHRVEEILMLLRNVLPVALVGAALVGAPTTALAAGDSVESMEYEAVDGPGEASGKASPGKGLRTMPPGIGKRPERLPTPAGIERTRGEPDPPIEEPDPPEEPDPDPEEPGGGEGVCIAGTLFVDGVPVGTC